MKWILVMSLCSFAHQDCQPIPKNGFLYDDWSTCMEVGYISSIKILNDIGKNNVNKHQIGTQIMCYETKGMI